MFFFNHAFKSIFSYQNYDIISYDINIVSIKNKKLLINSVINLFSLYTRC